MARYYRPGTQVVLKANKKEGWPRQVAIVDGKSKECYVVTLLPLYREGKLDDGLREVTIDQMMTLRDEAMQAKKK
jgi:hypothetical protein